MPGVGVDADDRWRTRARKACSIPTSIVRWARTARPRASATCSRSGWSRPRRRAARPIPPPAGSPVSTRSFACRGGPPPRGIDVDSDFDGGARPSAPASCWRRCRSGWSAWLPMATCTSGRPAADRERRAAEDPGERPGAAAGHFAGQCRAVHPLAEAEIVYIGEGELAGRQRPSWWARFLNWLGF